jgi:hypothetical protein
MQNPDRDSSVEQANVESGEGAQGGIENQINFAEGEAEGFDSDQPIIVQGGGTPQG